MNCEIKFLKNINGVFYAGSLLEGTVEIHLTECVKINAIICKIIGFAKCEWNIDISRYNLQKYSSRVDYLNHKIAIIDPSSDGIELTSSLNNFDFSFELPSSLPTSFKSKYGMIKYKIQVDLKFESLSKSEMFFELPFIVICPINLNEIAPGLKDPVRQELSKSFNFNIASSDINLVAVIPQGGYVVGQSIEVLIQVENLGKTRVKYLKISLKKVVLLTSLKPKNQQKKVSENEVKEVIYHEIPPKTNRDFLRAISIPPVPPNIENCEIISVTYELRIKAKTIGWNKSPVLKIPIKIGTIPIMNQNVLLEDSWHKKGALPPTYEETFRLSSTTDSSSDEE
ncbi:arrestin domain-containing protein 2-like [Chironomus tepperi]|uniref:arrestin domain-containing protein 2-like n=1 Tax=Chironomus tepperi TaxID=113505 RepID=UPI00391F85F0